MEEMKLTVDTGAGEYRSAGRSGRQCDRIIQIHPHRYGHHQTLRKGSGLFQWRYIPENPSEEEYPKLDDEIRGQLDYLLNGSVSEGVFAKCAPLTMISNGDFFLRDNH